jgi:uncharacterized protein
LVVYISMDNVFDFIAKSKADWESRYQDFLKPVIRHSINDLDSKLLVLFGIRGSGKTTLLFQKYSSIEESKRIFFNGDELKLLKMSLLDLFSSLEGFIPKNSFVFIDEINSIDNWSEELKIVFDKYSFSIIVSGSSSISLKQSKSILARRAKFVFLEPLSFREFLEIKYGKKYGLFNIDSKNILLEMSNFESNFKKTFVKNPVLLVEDFLVNNLPFLFNSDDSTVFDLIDKIIFDDITKKYNFSSQTLLKFQRLLFLLAGSNKMTYENISKDLGVSKSVVGEMLSALIESDLIRISYPFGKAKTVARKEWRYFFTIPLIRKILMKKAGLSKSDMVGLLYEDLFVTLANESKFLSTGPDFVFDNKLFEIGSKNKKQDQLKKSDLKLKKYLIQNTQNFGVLEDVTKLPFYMFLSIK